ncbi:MAG: ABC-F family ATP-binding cassette domain-containing protein [Patescibacteria group bacterium]|nr:ABC-F family ATP-binding cassette domain-containing protein [Patescibacteria group bacterium]
MANTQKSARPDFSGDTIIRFEDVSYEWGHNKPILDEASFSVRRGTKITLMGQNGAGKSTIFGLILGENRPESGEVHVTKGATIATARQVIPRGQMELPVREFFAACFKEKVYDLDPRIDSVLEVVNLHAHKTAEDIKDRALKSFSGGQQARLLLASALIQDPDILLLDEPTNNLDAAGIEHLTRFLVEYRKTCLVISHDADFLNAFTHGVLYLDVHTRKVEQYVGDYKDVVDQISARIEKENMANARLQKEIDAKKYQAGVFAQKGGGMRLVAKRMREKAEELEEDIVEVRKEDKTIKDFRIPAQPELVGEVISISSYSMISPKTHKPVNHACHIKLRKKQHLLISGPNGIGKSTLLEHIVTEGERSEEKGDAMSHAPSSILLSPSVRVGYYRQDFSMMDFNDTVYESLDKIAKASRMPVSETELRATSASFLIGADAIHTRIGSLSEGQKGLVAFARLVLQKPGLLILDEPTNHINFRHLPVIARALDAYEGAMILVSHVPEFVKQIRIDEVLEMGK